MIRVVQNFEAGQQNYFVLGVKVYLTIIGVVPIFKWHHQSCLFIAKVSALHNNSFVPNCRGRDVKLQILRKKHSSSFNYYNRTT